MITINLLPEERSMPRSTKSSAGPFLGCLGMIVLCIVVIWGFVSCQSSIGAGSWGPTRTWEATVISKHVDASSDGDGGKESHYMVTTDQGTFEVQNGYFLEVWNADEMFGRLKEGKKFRITTKGNKVVGAWYQEYPYVTSVVPIEN